MELSQKIEYVALKNIDNKVLYKEKYKNKFKLRKFSNHYFYTLSFWKP